MTSYDPPIRKTNALTTDRQGKTIAGSPERTMSTEPRTAFCPECKETVRVKHRRLFGAHGDFCDKCGMLLSDGDSTPDVKLPSCPWCRTNACVHASNANAKAFYCRRCNREFEAEDDGDIGYGRPSKRMERQEGRQSNHRLRGGLGR